MELTNKVLEQDLNRFFEGQESKGTFSTYCDIHSYLRKNWFPVMAKGRNIEFFNTRENRYSNQSFYVTYKNLVVTYITFTRSRSKEKSWRDGYKYTIKHIEVNFTGDLETKLNEIDLEATKAAEYKVKIKELAPQVCKWLIEKFGDKNLVLDVIKEISNNFYKY